VPFDDALSTAPREPGVYLARIGAEEHIVYVGLAGERSGNGKRQAASSRHPGSAQAIRDGTGRGVTSGLGEAVSDRAFADAAFVSERLAEIEQGEPKRAVEWGRAALAWADLHICWATTPDKASAEVLEARCGAALSSSGIWNRGAFRKLVE
jgi:excinuclease UvrABC nuclease subunit